MVEGLQKSCSSMESKAEEYLKKLKEGREEQATIEEQLRKELAQQVCLCVYWREYLAVFLCFAFFFDC